MADSGTSIGDVTATLRADLRDFVQNIQAARTQIRGLGTASTEANQAVRLAATGIDNWSAKLRAGTVTAVQYDAAIKRIQEDYLRASSAASGMSQAIAIVDNTSRRAQNGIGTLRSGFIQLGLSVADMRGPLGALTNGLLAFSRIGGAGVAVAAGLATLAAAYRVLTKDSREAREEQEKLLDALRRSAQSDIPDTVTAQRTLAAATEAYTRALDEQRRAFEALRTVSTDPTMTAKIGVIPGAGQGLSPGNARVEQASRDLAEARKKATQAQLESLAAEAKALQESLRLGVANNAERRRAVLLVEILTSLSLQEARAIDQRNLAAKAAQDLFLQMSPDQERVKKTEEDRARILLDLSRFGGLNNEKTAEALKLLDEYRAKLAAANLTDAERVKLLQQEKELMEALRGLGDLHFTEINPDEKLPFVKPKLPSGTNWLEPVEEKMTESMREMRRIVADGVHDIVRTFADGLLGGAKNIGDALIQTFRRAIAELIAAIVTQKLLDPIFKALKLVPGGGGGGDFGSAAGSAVGTAIGGPFGAIGGGFIGGLLFNQRSMGTVVVSGSAIPPSPSPIVTARDAQWQALFRETARVVTGQGLRLVVP